MNGTGYWRVACLSATLALTGCGEMVFKRGADPGSMASAQSACRADTQDETAYVACMRDKGYLVKGSQDSVFVDNDGASGSGGKSLGDALFVPGTAGATAAAAAKSAPPAAAVSAPAAAPAPVNSAPAAGSAPAAASAAVTSAPAPVPTPAAAPVTLDPLEQVDVASWWKLGGSPDQLKAAQDRCVATLGNGHRPDPAGTKVTRAMIGCLKEAGWRGIGR